MIMRRRRCSGGLTLIELMMATLATVVLILGSAAVLVYGHLGYHRLYNRINGWKVNDRLEGVSINAYEARSVFDRIVRSADAGYVHFAGVNNLWVYYYYEPSVEALVARVRPNRCAHFVAQDGALLLYRRDIPEDYDFSEPPDDQGPSLVLASNVATCQFTQVGMGAAIRMVLTLDNETTPEPGRTKLETSKTTISTTAIRHNNSLEVEL